jgi:hypothetical protein
MLRRWSVGGALLLGVAWGAGGFASAGDGRHFPRGQVPVEIVIPYDLFPYGFGYPAAPGALEPAAPPAALTPPTPRAPASPASAEGGDAEIPSPGSDNGTGFHVVPPSAFRAPPRPGGGYYVVPRP